MKTVILSLALLLTLLFQPLSLQAQHSSSFDLEAYKSFLEQHRNISFSELEALYPADELLREAPVTFSRALYADTVVQHYRLNDQEIELLERNSFVVTDRIRYKSFGEAFFTIYKRDLPVYLSSDAILHALHMSYSEILINLELQELKPRLRDLLDGLHRELPSLDDQYGGDPLMRRSLMDLDLYLAIPRLLLGDSATPFYSENESEIESLMGLVDAQNATRYPLFSPVDIPRDIDFSQFTPRGHYTQNERLTRYFQAMIWLGRSEFYLIPPESGDYNHLTEDQRNRLGQRQTINAYLLAEALETRALAGPLNEMERILTFLIGESDNVTVPHLIELRSESGFADAGSLADMDTYLTFRQNLENKPYASQRILSQILKTDPSSPDKIEPASAFLLLGQRFIIDSFVMANVVYDHVRNPNRMLPKSADVLFALGNNDALLVLKDELEEYRYEENLLALRYLIDQYDSEFWNSSFFNLWLNGIRTLNPDRQQASAGITRNQLPLFMQTEAWSRKNMNTQLASWAQLRHDNLLYGKQSYSGGPVCEYPHTYVEPVPYFFRAMGHLAVTAQTSFDNILDGSHAQTRVSRYFESFAEIMNKLAVIARKQLDGVDTTSEEKAFLQNMLHESDMCGVELTGWYKDLYFTGDVGALEQDYVVADVHTSPYSESGSRVGWVKHVGTGPLNLAVLSAELGDGNTYAFVGPVMSFYSHVTVDFQRLTDEEWVQMFEDEPALRPEFINTYLFDSGTFFYDHRHHVVSAGQEEARNNQPEAPGSLELRQNYPNPFNNTTNIAFRIPASLSNAPVKLTVYNVQGQLVHTLLNRPMPAGNYTVRWEANVASGTYYYRLEVADQVRSGSMTLIK
ncbi:DUF3160 domain-containing protein [Balneolales bacterium ANBcel1]|nr:DUF3160 domain-containing protein [Balneolales bacterium ANBcel1]